MTSGYSLLSTLIVRWTGTGVKRNLAEPADISRDTLLSIGHALRSARNAAGLNQSDAKDLVGLGESTVRNWEQAHGKGDWARQFLWLKEMAGRSSLAAKYVAQIVGLTDEDVEPLEDDLQLIVSALKEAKRRGRGELVEHVAKSLEFAGVLKREAPAAGD